MLGVGAVAQHVYNVLRQRTPVTAAVGNRIKNLSVLPEGTTLPACIHYAESATYGGPFTATMEPSEEIVSYLVRFICQGESDAPIRAATKDALTALAIDEAEGTVTQDDGSFAITLLPTGEWALTTTIENGVLYRQLGFYLQAQVFRL
jgi:hypothetical protein